MARYIDADALIKKIFPYDVVDKKCYTINAKMIYQAIQEAPTADVVSREDLKDILMKKKAFIPPSLPSDVVREIEVRARAATNTIKADVVPKSEEGAECPICHGTGRIGTTDWLTKGMSKKQLAEKKAKAIAKHEQHIKTEVAREIFEEIEKWLGEIDDLKIITAKKFAELKKKYAVLSKEDHSDG